MRGTSPFVVGNGFSIFKPINFGAKFGQVQDASQQQSGMEEKNTPSSINTDEDVLRLQSFKRPSGLNLDAFVLAQQDQASNNPPSTTNLDENAVDAAVGEVKDMFTRGGHGHEKKVSGDEIFEGAEQRISHSLAIAMVVVWTAIGALVGTVLPPVIGAAGLLLMAGVGIALGERWIRRDSMHILGLTWVIISMKLLYGLALDMWRWSWLDGVGLGANENLGLLMLGLVGLNVALAFRHDEDAIAAQSALVLFAVGSSAGAVFGENGVAVFMIVAMLLMHGLALVRKSGNLASLGISISYLWVGVHALSNHWTILSVTLVPIENGLVLFLLLAVVTAANAAMAALFVHHENWLSQAVQGFGFGKPGLWAVSVSLGMIGALMVIASHRDETGYALAQLMMLTLAFSASYLVVRGVAWTSLLPWVLAPMPVLIAGLSLLNTSIIELEIPFALTEYSAFAILTAALCVVILTSHQTNVSDHVLWLGSVVIVILLTILIPANEGGPTSRLLLASQGVVWLGLGVMAYRRDSPTMAGVSVLAPYVWLLIFATNFDQRLLNSNTVPILLDEVDIGWWMLALVAVQIIMCTKLGEVTLNLGSSFVGRSEMSSRIRDTEFLNLWNLSFFISAITYLSMAHKGGLTALGMYLGMGALLLSHTMMVWLERIRGRPSTMVLMWSIAALILAWRFGQESIWAVLLTIGSVLLVFAAIRHWQEAVAKTTQQERDLQLPGQLLTLHLMMMTALFLVAILAPSRQETLTGNDVLSTSSNIYLLTCFGTVSLGLYTQRLSALHSLLLPSIAALGVLLSMALVGFKHEMPEVSGIALVLFVAVGTYLAFQGDVRAGLKALATKEQRLASFNEKKERMGLMLTTSATSESSSTSIATLKALDAELLRLSEKQRRRSKRSDVSADEDVLVGDIHYRPVVLMLFLSVAFLAAMWFAYSTSFGLASLAFSAGFAVLLVGVARLRATQIGLRLPDVMGVELPIAMSMGGLVLVHIASRLTVGVLDQNDIHQAILFVALVIIAAMGLSGRNDLGLRIPSALEYLLLLLVFDRILCLVLGGQTPLPFTVHPFDAPLLDGTVPLLLMELMYIGTVVLFDWVEGERLRRGLDDHRGAAGRSAWVLGVAILSLGMASMLAIVFALRRARMWQQPAVALTSVVSLPFVLKAMSVWALTPTGLTFSSSLVTASIAIGCVLWVAVTVWKRYQLWLSSALWACHLMAYPAGLMMESLVMLSLAALMTSTTSWVSGILTRRKSWRVFGALDLLLGWLFALVAFISGASSTYVLMMLVASALLLFAVTTLTQANEQQLLQD